MKYIKKIINYLLGLFNRKIITNNDLLIEEDFVEFFPPTTGYIANTSHTTPKEAARPSPYSMDQVAE